MVPLVHKSSLHFDFNIQNLGFNYTNGSTFGFISGLKFIHSVWDSISHSVSHLFRHSISHLVTHSFRHSISHLFGHSIWHFVIFVWAFNLTLYYTLSSYLLNFTYNFIFSPTVTMRYNYAFNNTLGSWYNM